MTDGDTIAQVAVVVLLLLLAVPALATAHELSGTPLPYEEQLTIDEGNSTSVSQNATLERYSENVTIRSEGETLSDGDDYRWNETSGEVSWLSSTNTTEAADATIEYQAHQRTGETRLAWIVVAPLMGLFGLFGLVASARAILNLLGEVWT